MILNRAFQITNEGVHHMLRLIAATLLGFTSISPLFAVDASEASNARHPLAKFVEQGRIAGGVTLLAHEGEIVRKAAVGKADLDTDAPATTETMFAIASMTKPITATAVMILQEEGKLSIDDPVGKYILAFKNAKLKDGTPAGEITLRQLMSHTSGLGGDQRITGSLAETVQEIAERPLAFAPGTKWQYSPGLTVCGRVIEIVSKQPYETFLAERIFKPLDMQETTFRPTEEQRQRIARIYDLSDDGAQLVPAENRYGILPADENEGPNPSAGLYSTASDLATFYQMILNGGVHNAQRIVSAESVSEMTRVQTGKLKTGFTPGNGWGLGWCIVREPQGVTAMLSPGTFGHGGAFGTQAWIDPETETIFVLLIARSGLPNSDASDMRRVFQSRAVGFLGE